MRLDQFDSGAFDRGRPALFEMLWLILQAVFVSSWLPGSTLRVLLLRLFGARIGRGVNIKPRVRVKFPWRLDVGDHAWIGESCWIDNLAPVRIGDHCCLSQGVYLCTGSHDWSRERFDLMVEPITIDPHAWLAARSVVGPGVTVGTGAVLTLGSVATKELDPWTICHGSPAVSVKERPRAAID